MSTQTIPATQAQQEVSFFVRLGEDDWEPDMAAWLCPPLMLPGSGVKDIYSGGKRIDEENYRIIDKQSYIRWASGTEAPRQITAFVSVDKEAGPDLVSKKEKAEKQEALWRRFAIIVPIITAGIAGYASWAVAQQQASKPPADTSTAAIIATCKSIAADIRANLDQIDKNLTQASNNIVDSCSGGPHGTTPANGPATMGLINTARGSVSQIREQAAKLP